MEGGVAYGKEKVRHVVCDVHGDAHVGEVEAVAEPDQRQRDDVMRHQLLEVLARLLQHQQQHDRLLGPVARLQEVVRLENSLMRPVREPLVHAGGVEVPHGAAAHDPQAKGPVQAKVQRRVRLLHEAALLGAALDTASDGDGADEALHAELAREAQHDNVEADKGEVARALAVVRGRIAVGADGRGDQRVRGRQWVREEQARGDGVGRVRVDEVEGDGCEQENQREQPCVADAGALELGEAAADGAAFRAAGGFV